MCHADPSWMDTLPVILLGIRASVKEDIKSSSAELVYEEPLRQPGEFLISTRKDIPTSEFLRDLHRYFETIHPTPTSARGSKKTFVHKELSNAKFVFLGEDALRPAIFCPYRGPYEVIDRNSKTLKTKIGESNVRVSTNRVKPAFTAEDDQSTSPTPSSATEHTSTQYRTRFGRVVRPRIQ
ncbi:uncharacterized protein LOC113375789 [Ctenocephalides felis]|uniref:uncharacterized protein LOC113375789 n=1 Tax=Ctenocephalides felis TaxID=7515 RepID=UPI000E6E1FB2|nr:uncharacterized protein LOC113375789 [Ctenocephalides felis]